MADYATVTEIKLDIPDSPAFDLADSTYDTALGGMITAASRAIDRYVGGCDNYFYSSTDAVTRYYDGSGEENLWIDPFVSITTVSVSESGGRAATDYTAWTVNTDFYTYPYNRTPIELLIVDNDSGSKGNWGVTRKGVKIVGIEGYSLTVPTNIKQACKMQAVRWFMRAKQGYQDSGANASIGEMFYTQELDPDVKTILAPYKTHNAVMA